MNWGEIGSEILNLLKNLGIILLEIVFIGILGFFTIKILSGLVHKILNKSKINKVTTKFLIKSFKIALYFLLILIICQVVGIPITGFVAVLSAAGLALSLAMQGSLSNLANGIVLIGTQPFKEGDYVRIGDIEGTISEIKMLHTIINSVDNKRISVPNTKVVDSELVNYSSNQTRKIILNFSTAIDNDVSKILSIINESINSCDLILTKCPTKCYLQKIDNFYISFYCECWCKTNDYLSAYNHLLETTLSKFKEHKIILPYNQIDVNIK